MVLLPFVVFALAQQSSSPQPTDELQKTRGRILYFTNGYRTDNKAPELRLNETLNKAAQFFAEDMARRNFFDHTDPDGKGLPERLKAFGVVNVWMAENIALGQTSPEDVMMSWMRSTGHRKNILNPVYRLLGVGYTKTQKGKTYWVQIFADKVPPTGKSSDGESSGGQSVIAGTL